MRAVHLMAGTALNISLLCVSAPAGVTAYCGDILPPCAEDLDSSGDVSIHDLLGILRHWSWSDSVYRPWPDASGDCAVDEIDLVLILNAWGTVCDGSVTGACLTMDGTCTVTSWTDCINASGAFHEGATCTDSDSDRLPDAFELNDGGPHAPGFAGSDPSKSDTDDDAILDGDEVLTTSGGLNLSALGCSPVQPDVLIEVDWVHEAGATDPDANELHANQIQTLQAAFTTEGVNLIIDLGEALEDPSGDDELNLGPYGSRFTVGEYATLKAANFDANRAGYFHYCLMCDRYAKDGVSTGSSGFGEITGDDFLVAVGQFITGDHDWVGLTFMHELGHNLGLNHGGDESTNYKPNYVSIMNYAYQFCGADIDGDAIGDGGFDYGHGTHPNLDETDLDESAGITGLGPWIDWDDDGEMDSAGMTLNINCSRANCSHPDAYAITCGNSDPECDDSNCDTLSDHDDWAAVDFNGINSGFTAPAVIECDNTPTRP